MFFRSPDWTQTTLWALDLETSGLSAKKDLILSVGMVPIREGVIRWGERDYRLVKPPEGHVPPREALRIHHILPEEARHGDDLRQAVSRVLPRLENAALLVHYGKLDVRFLKEACRTLKLRWPKPVIVDTVRLLSRLSHRLKSLDPYARSLPTDLLKAREELGLPAHMQHHALFDALATAELFLALCERLELKTLRSLR